MVGSHAHEQSIQSSDSKLKGEMEASLFRMPNRPGPLDEKTFSDESFIMKVSNLVSVQ